MKKAFTLSEILITLGIIGVVAAMTMPVLITNYQKQVTASKLKQTYSILSQALERSRAENGDPDNWDFGGVSGQPQNAAAMKTAADNFLNNYLLKYIQNKKFVSKSYDIYPLNGVGQNKLPNQFSSAYILKNGTLVSAWFNNNGKVVTDIFFTVDLNSSSGPNVYGKDIFFMNITSNNKLYKFDFYNWSNNREYILNENCNKQKSGMTCGKLIQIDGWKISDDYPW